MNIFAKRTSKEARTSQEKTNETKLDAPVVLTQEQIETVAAGFSGEKSGGGATTGIVEAPKAKS